MGKSKGHRIKVKDLLNTCVKISVKGIEIKEGCPIGKLISVIVEDYGLDYDSDLKLYELLEHKERR